MTTPAVLAVWIDRRGERHVQRITACLCVGSVTCLSHLYLAHVFEEAVAMVLVPLKSHLSAVDNTTRREAPAVGGGAR